MGFAVSIHVANVGLGYLSAVETVQKTSSDLHHHGPVWDGLGHAVDGSLKDKKHVIDIFFFFLQGTKDKHNRS